MKTKNKSRNRIQKKNEFVIWSRRAPYHGCANGAHVVSWLPLLLPRSILLCMNNIEMECKNTRKSQIVRCVEQHNMISVKQIENIHNRANDANCTQSMVIVGTTHLFLFLLCGSFSPLPCSDSLRGFISFNFAIKYLVNK